ncbi:MAG: undecaprenyl/decaprenyl-phosphate alpha-N-acetylglucosaminyl 1-phosphate transferase [Deltaproteobacteria bacterium]|nr:undecaprenyl/decaprenyl-phosphate alpha-N-acetylglucosaminyl 1-phosphate transferase [Deltaproteobacteria bacterium]
MPALIRAARSLKLVDLPDGRLKTHMSATPVLGGIGIALGATAGAALTPHAQLPVLGAAWVLALLGFLDDRSGLGISIRVGAEAAAGAGLFFVGAAFAGDVAWALPLSILAAIGCVNALNMLDGIDGLAGGLAAIAALGFAVVFALLKDLPGASFAIALAAACLGFLVFNFHPARIFMGDCGSYFLGFALFVLLARLQRTSELMGLGAGLLIIGVLVGDSTWAMIRRVRAGRSPFDGDREHLYDRLIERGLSVRKTVLVMYGLALAMASLGAYVALRPALSGLGGH